MVCTPVLLQQGEFHTGIEQALVVHFVCQHCCLHKGVQIQAKNQLSDAALHQLIHLCIKCQAFAAVPSCPTSCVRLQMDTQSQEHIPSHLCMALLRLVSRRVTTEGEESNLQAVCCKDQ